MKLFISLFKVLFVSQFFIISTGFAQETHYVTIHVDTDKITDRNSLEVCYFTSKSPNMETVNSEGNIQEFNIAVNPGDTIIWRGISSSNIETSVVNIRSINYQSGDNVFDFNILYGNNQPHEEVIGVVKLDTYGQVQKYNIDFTVFNEGVRRGNIFRIDPKITIKPL